jgi:hypothetical protein
MWFHIIHSEVCCACCGVAAETAASFVALPPVLLLIIAQDLSEVGKLLVKAGEHVLCDVIFAFKSGRMLCDVLKPGSAAKPMHLPPAILGSCRNFIQNSYRAVLPAYMLKPSAAVALQPAAPAVSR